MSAQPIAEHDPDDPVEILRVLPEKYHDQFRREYETAVEAARQMLGYRALHELLRLWRLRAITYSDSGYEIRLAAVQEAARTGGLEGSVPIEDVVPDWTERLEAHRRQR
ncbi:DUF6247 family protein [Actinomadura alba]|uniref:Uncharacterized protein n=1 Tax=Actinomadura alba TaxID=406431 RepID=A0ABR7M1K5_9ACTN|nr:DUF6247 family protein [Actinomadura alba]MBC6470949.1 hypothetical protein [Actinomadura alba]